MKKLENLEIIYAQAGGTNTILVTDIPDDLVVPLVDEIKATITFYKNLWNKDEKGKV